MVDPSITEDRDTDLDWVEIGGRDPYWGVISHDRFRGGGIAGAAANEFFKSGSEYVQNLLGFVHRHLGPFQPAKSLDFGCGVGRILLPLAEVTTGETVGVDVSQPMLDLARGHAEERGLMNIRLVDDLLVLEQAGEAFDFVNTFIVLQHVPPKRGLQLIDRLLALTAIHGVFSLQLTFAKGARFLPDEAGQPTYFRRDGDTITLLDSAPRRAPVGAITMFDYDLNQVFARLLPRAGQPVMIMPTNHDDHLGLHIVGQRVR